MAESSSASIAPALSSAPEVPHFTKPESPQNPRKRLASPNLTDIASAGLRTSSGPTLGKIQKTGKFTSQRLTATAAVIADEKRRQEERKPRAQQTSSSTQRATLTALMGIREAAMSAPNDAPNAPNAPRNLHECIPHITNTLNITDDAHNETNNSQTSPASLSSLDTTDSPAGGVTITVASPGQIGDGAASEPRAGNNVENKSFSYPGPLLSSQLSTDIRRDLSLPHTGLSGEGPRSPPTTQKKHKCPFCDTEFTRHHNLKSHLLTHSQEKPYVCQQCEQRFRRLHDLKRHTKLHTGERPHVCSKCGRSFARGDALARHTKASGGCAGRKSSIGNFAGEEAKFIEQDQDQHEETMEGLLYTKNIKNLSGSDRRKSVPTMQRHAISTGDLQVQAPNHLPFQRQPSTYPPVRQPGSLYPPNINHTVPSTSPSPGSQTGTIQFSLAPANSTNPYHAAAPVFTQGGMTESPKPLSQSTSNLQPDQTANRSPSFAAQQFQLNHRQSTRSTTPPVGLHPPLSSAPQLPSLAGLAPDSRFTLQSTPYQNANQSSHGTRGRMQSQNGTDAAVLNSSVNPSMLSPQLGNEDLYNYMHMLEDRLNRVFEDMAAMSGVLENQQRELAQYKRIALQIQMAQVQASGDRMQNQQHVQTHATETTASTPSASTIGSTTR